MKSALPELSGYVDKKFILNFKIEGNFPAYVTVARRLLIDEKAKLI
jgi:hypothetical protein